MRALTTESRVIRRGSLGDRISGRSREGRFVRQCERELLDQLGASVTFTQKMLVRRLARALLRLELLDEKAMASMTDYDARTFSALSNQVRLLSRELGLKAAPAVVPTSLANIVSRHKAGSS